MASIHLRGKKFYASFKDRSGKWRLRCTNCTDKGSAQLVANKWESQETLIRTGVVKLEEAAPVVDFSTAIANYQKKLEVSGISHRHALDTIRIVEAFRQLLIPAVSAPAEVKVSHVERYLSSLRSAPNKEKTSSASSRTRQKHLTILKKFLRQYLSSSEYERLKEIRITVKTTQPRRMLLPAEWAYLKEFLTRPSRTPHTGRNFTKKEAPPIVNPYGPRTLNMSRTTEQRLLIYWTAISTGLRASELRVIRSNDLVFPDTTATTTNGISSLTPYLLVRPSDTKNAKTAKQYLPPDLASCLVGKLPLRMPRPDNVARMVKKDLLDARKAYVHECEMQNTVPDPYFLSIKNEAGERFNFHSFRHSFCSYLAMQNTPVPVLMRLARHSDPKLTLLQYGHIYPSSEADEITRCKFF